MAKFSVGDKVVCVWSEFTELDHLRDYTIKSVANDDGIDITEYFLEGADYTYMETRFELLSEWEKHQKPVDIATELELTKQQTASLQAWKNEAITLLERALFKLDDCHVYKLAEEINEFLGD